MPSSVTLINEIAGREGGNVRSKFIDIDDPETTLFKNKFVVSSYALMYLGLSNSCFFETLLQSEPLGGLFLEPIFDDIDSSNQFAAERKNYYEDNSYNKEWFSQFCSLIIEQGNYEIIYRKPFFSLIIHFCQSLLFYGKKPTLDLIHLFYENPRYSLGSTFH